MRLLPDRQKNALLDEICSYTQEKTDFQLPDCDLHVQVIPGETEGLYGWIAANYLLEGFDHKTDHKHDKEHYTFGFVDMGGASAQIAFVPNATETKKHADDLTMLRLRTVGGTAKEYKLFVSTWLGFGVNEARKRYVNNLLESTDDTVSEVPDPCLPVGLALSRSGTILNPKAAFMAREPYLIGTGNLQGCLRQTYPLLGKDVPCDDTPCLLHGDHVPSIDFNINHFVGVSEYWHMTHKIFEMGYKDQSYDFDTYQNRVNEFCGQNWQDIVDLVEQKKWGKKVDRDDVRQACFKASWVINMLHNGIGIPRVGVETPAGSAADGLNSSKTLLENAKENTFLNPFQAVNKIHGTEVSWTLGKMVLYASSQIPPADESLAVGFGRNQPGISDDFHYAGGSYLPSTGSTNGFDWEVSFADWNISGVVSGLLLFILMIAFATFCYCSSFAKASCRRSRHDMYRQRKSSRARRGSKERRRSLASKLFLFAGGNKSGYERASEYSPTSSDYNGSSSSNDVERGPARGSFHDGSGSKSMYDQPDFFTEVVPMARSSGWATPQLSMAENSRPQTASHYFDSWLAQSQSQAFDSGNHPANNTGLGVALDSESPPTLATSTSNSNINSNNNSNSNNKHFNGIGPFGNAMDRAGLMARTDSRERVPSFSVLSPLSQATSNSQSQSPQHPFFPRTNSHSRSQPHSRSGSGSGPAGVLSAADVGTASASRGASGGASSGGAAGGQLQTPLLMPASLTTSLSSLSLSSLLPSGGHPFGSKSRTASPSRMKSPLLSPLKESID